MYIVRHRHWDDHIGSHYPHDEWYVIEITTQERKLATCYTERDAAIICEALTYRHD